MLLIIFIIVLHHNVHSQSKDMRENKLTRHTKVNIIYRINHKRNYYIKYELGKEMFSNKDRNYKRGHKNI